MPGSDADLTRRQLLVSGALAAGYALAARPVAAQAITTDATGLVAGEVEIPVATAEAPAEAGDAAPGSGGSGELRSIPAYRARPAASAATPPVVLVVHEIFGVHEYIRDVCRRLAREGYLAVAPDLYRRHGDVSQLESIDEILTVVRAVPDARVLADLDATLAWVEASGEGDASRAAITGFCWGGRVVWLYAAHRPGLKAGAAWYGRLSGATGPTTPAHPLDLAPRLRAPVLGLYGTEDRGIPVSQVEAMRARLAETGSPSEILLFPAAPHGFHADYRPSYRAAAAEEGWRRMLAWFTRHGSR